ncbi:hypothetical protein [Nitrospira sp. Nam74]
MRILFIAPLLVMFVGCQTSPSGHWTQAGKTDQDAQADYAHCEKVSMQEANGMRSTDVFKEDIIKEVCMKRMGYQYVQIK